MKTKIICVLLLLTAMTLPATADTTGTAESQSEQILRQLPQLRGAQRLQALKQLSYLSQFSGNDAYNRQCIANYLDEAIRQQDEQAEGNARITLMAYYYNKVITDSLISESPAQLEFFREHKQWGNYYYAWKMTIEFYAYEQHYTTALSEAERMHKDAQSRQDDYGMAYSNFCLGVVYANMGNYEESVKAYEQCLKHRQLDQRLKHSVYYYACEALSYLKDYDRLMTYTDNYWATLQEDYSQMADDELAASPHATPCLIFRAKVLTAKGELDEAYRMLEKARPTAMKRKIHSYHLLYTTADYYAARHDLKQALQVSDELIELTTKVEHMETARNMAEEQRADLLMKAKRYEEAALLWQSVYRRTTNSNTTEIQRQLSEMNTLFEVNRLKLQGERTKQQARFVSGSMAAILVVVGLLIFLSMNNRWSRRLEVKNRQLERERNVVVAQNHQLATERDRAEAASKAKTAFMQSMTHEIRTPLNAISGFSQVLATPGMELAPEDAQDFSLRIQQNTQLLTNILNDMLEISDLDSQKELPQAEEYPAAVLCAQATDTVQPRLQPTVTLRQESHVADELMVKTQPRLVLMALDKLLDNAAKFTKEGEITLKLDYDDASKTLHFTVTDTGPGIPEDKSEYVFERFAKIDSFTQGAGLGLSVARMIAERLGGTLTLDTQYHGGAKFDLTIQVES